MYEVRYDVMFYGDVLAGFSPDSVKRDFANLFTLSEEKVEQIFSAPKVILKPALDELTAHKYQRALGKIGALVVLEQHQPALVVVDDEEPSAVLNSEPSAVLNNEPSAAVENDPSDVMADESAQKLSGLRELKFQFHGSGIEYFKIWIVNIFLSIITLGIYSAWAKVRNKQYFYGNTELEESTFVYLASPITILKGRLIALGIVILYSVSTNLSPLLGGAAVLLMLLASPFFVQRSLMFNARNSAYRNIRFNFDGTFKESVVIFCGLPLLFMLLVGGSAALGAVTSPLLTAVVILALFGLGMPYFIFRQKNYLANNSLYGTAGFEFSSIPKDFFSIWGKLVLWSIASMVVAFIGAFLVGLIFGVSMPGLSGSAEDARASMGAIIPMMISMCVIFGICYLFPFVYYSVKVNNLFFNSTTIDRFQLHGHFELKSYGKLVLVNTLLTVLTLGFYRPWAMVNTARYKAGHISVMAEASLDQFVAGEEDNVGALGDEIGEFYDLDFGF